MILLEIKGGILVGTRCHQTLVRQKFHLALPVRQLPYIYTRKFLLVLQLSVTSLFLQMELIQITMSLENAHWNSGYIHTCSTNRRKIKKIEWCVCEFILWKCQVQTNNASKVANHVLITELILCIIIIICMCPQCT